MCSSPRRVTYIASNDLVKVSSLLPSNRSRSLLVHSLVKSFGLLSSDLTSSISQIQIVNPPPADYKELSAYHSRDYLEFVLNAENATPDFGHDTQRAEYGLEEDCPTFVGLPTYVRLVAGASLAAANSLINERADVAICWDGGRHHAHKSHASGFCYVADCVLAILNLRRARAPALAPTVKTRVMYIDLDLHFSDGVSQAFASSSSTPQVLTLSIHHTSPGFFPVSALAALPDPSDASFDPFTLSLPLAQGASNATFARIWPSVERIKHAFKPDYVVVQCGVDGLAGDPYAIWNWSLGGQSGSLGWCIEQVLGWKCKTLLLGGGGYHSANAARAWTYLTSIVLSRPLPLDADIPDHPAFPQYAPSFTLDVPPGNVHDQNTDKYLERVSACFRAVSETISERIAS